MPKARSSRSAGFSLPETLVALFILALIASAGGALLMGGASSSKQVQEREARLRTIDLAQAFLRNDLQAMTDRARTSINGFGASETLLGGESIRTDALLSFVRNGWLNPGGLEARSGLQAVRYTLEGRQLIREAVLRPDDTDASPVVRRILLEDVQDIRVRFMRKGVWSDFWEGGGAAPHDVMPDLVEVEIIFTDRTRLVIASLTGTRA